MYCKIGKEVNENTGRYKYRADYTYNLYKSCLDAIRYDKETRKTLSVYRKAKREFRYWTYAEFRQFLAMNKDLDGFKALERAFHPTKFEFSREYMYYVMFNFFFTGVRTEELRGITWNDIIYIDDRLDEVDINKAFTNHVCEADREEYIKNHHNLKNNESCRRVPILPELKYILEEYRIYFETYFEDIGDKFLFFGQNVPESLLGYNTIDNQIKKRIKSSKVRYISKHDFRRSCAMFLCCIGFFYVADNRQILVVCAPNLCRLVIIQFNNIH